MSEVPLGVRLSDGHDIPVQYHVEVDRQSEYTVRDKTVQMFVKVGLFLK